MNTLCEITFSGIAATLKTVLPNLTGDDQKVCLLVCLFLKGGYIGENMRRGYRMTLCCKLANSNYLAYFQCWLLEKAFDSVAWSLTEKSSSTLKFAKDVKLWISTFYTT